VAVAATLAQIRIPIPAPATRSEVDQAAAATAAMVEAVAFLPNMLIVAV
jgi:hypothetical protein